MNSFWKMSWASLVLACLTLGCGGDAKPELGTVKGKVMVNGQPGADLQVVFEPQAKGTKKADSQVGAASTGQTDASGAYELSYQGGTKGAVVGKHTVRVSNISGGGPAGGEAAVAPTVLIPEKFNTESEETREVKPGDNTIDIEIQTAQ
jgi:hypothetical protein